MNIAALCPGSAGLTGEEEVEKDGKEVNEEHRGKEEVRGRRMLTQCSSVEIRVKETQHPAESELL